MNTVFNIDWDLSMTISISIVTHPQPNYDPRGAITAAIRSLSGLEVMVLLNDRGLIENGITTVDEKSGSEDAKVVVGTYEHNSEHNIYQQLNLEKENIFYSLDGRLDTEKAKDIIESYDGVRIFGGCLDMCHYRTYASLADAFKKSSKKKLTVNFFLGGIFNDYFPSIPLTFNLNEILDFNGNEEQGKERDLNVLDLFERNTDHLRYININCNLAYNGRLLYQNNQGTKKTLNIEVFN